MNYLAHLFLAEDTPESRTGNLIADFIKGDMILQLPDAVQAGVRQHRGIDRFTDTHIVVKRSRYRLGHQWLRVSGIILDVYHDHLLARDWERHCAVSLRSWLDAAYGQIVPVIEELPEPVRSASLRIVNRDVMMTYQHESGAERALRSISRRMRHGDYALQDSLPELRRHDAALEADFREFFGDVQAFARTEY